MRRRSHVHRWILASVVACVFPASGRAEYGFLNDFEGAASQLVSDLQNDSLDTTNIAPEARSYLVGALSDPKALRHLQSLGRLKSVCPNVTVDFPNGRQFAFRSLHERGGTDWVVNVSRSPETVESVVNLGPGIGVPAILPIIPQGVTPQPPVQIGCVSPTEMQATNDQLQEACRRWPKMC